VPLPPDDVSATALWPYVMIAGAFTVSVAWVAFWSVTVAAADVTGPL
jgi:hypothetical protein